MSAALIEAFTWPALSNQSVVAYTMIQVTWYCNLVMGIISGALELHRSIFLMIIRCLPVENAIYKRMLSYNAGNGRRVAGKEQVIIWQIAICH